MTLRVEIARDPTQYFVPQNTLLLLQPNIGYVCVFVNNFCSYQCTNLDDHQCCTLSHPRSNYTSSNTSVHPSSNFQFKYAYLQVSSSAQLLGFQDPSDMPSILCEHPLHMIIRAVLSYSTVLSTTHKSRRPTI